MADPTLAVGATGFTPPLDSGTYTFLVQQTGSANTSYRFDYFVTAVPEPAALGSFGPMILFGLNFLRRNQKK